MPFELVARAITRRYEPPPDHRLDPQDGDDIDVETYTTTLNNPHLIGPQVWVSYSDEFPDKQFLIIDADDFNE